MELSKSTILIVDDNPQNLDVLGRMLRDRGYEIRTAKNGRLALKSVDALQPDLILLDIHMPEMDGYEVCRRLKADSRQKSIPLIFISALNETFNKVRGFQLGAVDYIVKPFEMTEVYSRIRTHLELSAYQKRLAEENRLLLNRFENTFQQVSVGIAYADLSGHLLQVNRCFCNILGYEEEEIVTKHIMEMIHPDDREKEASMLERLLKGECDSYLNEMRILCKSGSYLLIQISGTMARKSDGSPDYFIGVGLDISRRKEAEERLRRSEERFRGLMESAADAMIIVDESHYIVQVNLQCEKLFGYSREELLGKEVESLIPVEFRDKHRIKKRGYFNELNTRMMGENLEVRALKKDGTSFPVEISLSPLKTDEGMIISTTIRDITSRKLSEAALIRSESRLKEAQSLSKMGNWELDLKGNRLYWSDEIYKIFGMEPGSFKATYEAFVETIYPEDRERVNRAYLEHLEHKEPYDINHRILLKDGTVKYVHEKCRSEFDDEGKPVKSIGTVQDITKEKLAEEKFRVLSERFAMATDAARIGVWEFDVKSNAILWDDMMYSLYGLKREDFPDPYEGWYQAVHPDDKDSADHEGRLALKGEINYNTSFRIIWPDKSVRHIRALANLFRDEEGEPDRMIGVNWDITESKTLEYINQTLLELSRQASQLSYDDLIQRTLDSAVELTSGKVGFFHFISPDQSYVSLQAWSTGTYSLCSVPSEGKGSHYSIEKAGIWVDCIRQKRSLIYNDYPGYPAKSGQPEGHVELQRFMSVPIMSGDRFVAIIGVGNKETDYTDFDLEVLGILARNSWNIIKRKQTEEEILKLNEKLEDRVRSRTSLLEAANRSLGESEEKFRGITSAASSGIVMVDRSGSITLWNRAAEKIFGRKQNEIIGRKFHGLLGNAMNYKLYRMAVRLFRHSELTDSVGRTLELTALHKNGQRFPIELSLSSVNINGEWNAIGIINDITTRKEAEEELRKLSQAVKYNPASIVITDPEGVIEYVNPKFCRVTGFREEEAVGKNPRILKSGKHSEEFYRELWQRILAGLEWRGEIINRKKLGELFWESVSISPIFDSSGKIIHFVGIKEDITERKQMEQELKLAKEAAEAATRAKSDFLANMSHEIRTPMNAIISLNYLLAQTELTAKQGGYVSKIKNSARGLLGIINDILDFSKIEAGKLEVENIEFKIKDVIANLGNMLNHKIKDKGLKLYFEINTNIPGRLIGDPLRLGQILLNLTGNAIKFTRKGAIRIGCELVRLEGERVTLKFMVTDSGIGMSEEQKKRLFQPFSQADTSITRKYGGTGLGLSISRGLVRIMGGRLWIKSKLNVGSTFFFTINCLVNRERRVKRRVIPEELVGLRVMVVDNDEASGILLRDFIKAFTFHADYFAEGAKALEQLSRTNRNSDEAYRLVLLDWKMPGLNGTAVMKRIKAMQDIIQPKIMIVTGYGREEIIMETELAGADGYIFKPVAQSMLFDTILQAFVKLERRKPVEKREQERESLPGSELKVLLVEDNEINQQVAVEILEQRGINVDVAENGEDALTMIGNNSYNLVLMDLQMPIMDGFKATEEIRKNEDYAELPVIAMTADAMRGVEKEALSVGMNDYITKPIDPDKLFETIERWSKISIAAPSIVNAPDRIEEELPEIRHIVVKEGLSRLGGNLERYLKLISKFRKNNSDSINLIRAQIEKRDYGEARKLVHAIKGVSGNIGANKLFKASSFLDNALIEREDDKVEELFGHFITRMRELFASIEEYESSRTEEPDGSVEEGEALTEEELAAIKPGLIELKKLLALNNTRSIKLYNSIVKPLRACRCRQELLALEDCLDNYNFEKALALLKKFIEDHFS